MFTFTTDAFEQVKLFYYLRSLSSIDWNTKNKQLSVFLVRTMIGMILKIKLVCNTNLDIVLDVRSK